MKELNEKWHTTFIDLGTCSLHSANNGFGKLAKLIDDIIELDQMAIDFHFFHKYSACRREDFAEVSEITGLLSRHLVKHCTSRWISLGKVLMKLIEQFGNIKEYLFNKFKTLPGFDGKRGIASTVQYKLVKEYLTDKRVLILMHFVVCVAQDFQSFMKSLQNQKLMTHVRIPKCMDLIHLLLQRFMKNYKVMRSKEPIKRNGANQLDDVNINDASNHKVNPF